jgi:arylsulfatase A-like enzyme
MNRRNFLGLSASALAGVSTKASVAAQPTQMPASDRPNFLFMIADDLMYRTIHSINNPEVHTPNLDRLAGSGCCFSHCFHQGSWTGAVCVASRTMLNTGLSTFHAHIPDAANQALEKPVWGQTLREAGYDTFITGKWHLDAVSLQRSFSEQGPVAPGFLPSTPDMYDRPAPGNRWDPANESLKGHWLDKSVWLGPKQPGIQHSSELYADAAVRHLQNLAGRSHPFFMYVGFNAPHDPRQAPQKYLDLYPIDKIQVPPNFVPEHPFDQGEHRTRDELLAPFPRTPYDVQVHRREYYALISHLDSQIGRILNAL